MATSLVRTAVRNARNKGAGIGPTRPMPSGAVGGAISGGVKDPTFNTAFPEFAGAEFPTIKAAPFKFTDPQDFAAKYGAFNTDQINKNWAGSKDMALDALDTELQGLKSFAPAAAALSREQVSIDNQLNQAMRTSQVKSIMPFAAADLEAQRRRATDYAAGKVPDSVMNNALSLKTRSTAADNATFSGIGPKSMAANKLSDLMSVDSRLQLAQYGEGAIASNQQATAGLLMSPLEYSQAGSQIKVMPEVGAGRLSYQGLGMLNEATLISPSAALTATIGQEQFKTNLEQRTREFNATGTFNAGMFNATGMYQAGVFQYGAESDYIAKADAADQSRLNIAAGLGISAVSTGAAAQMSGMGEAVPTSLAGGGGGDTSGLASTLQGISGAANAIGSAYNAVTGEGETSSGGSGLTKMASAPMTVEQAAATMPSATSLDVGSPAAIKFAQGSSMPAGYVATGQNGDGTVSGAHVSDYEKELDRFSRSNAIPSSDIKVENAAVADRTLSNNLALSYVPVPGFAQIATLSSGKPVYALPAAATGTDVGVGQSKVLDAARALGEYGLGDPEMAAYMSEIYGANNPANIAQIDQLQNPAEIARALQTLVLGKAADMSTDDGQKLGFQAARLGEIWNGLSPQQKAAGIGSMTGSALNIKAGRDVSQSVIPGTDKSLVGGLKLADAAALEGGGVNSRSLARNWNQISSMLAAFTGSKDPKQIGKMAQQTGFLGFGPEASSVPLKPGQLKAVGAQAAPAAGVGAMVFKKFSDLPKNYKKLSETSDGRIIAIPAPLQHTAILGTGGVQMLSMRKAQEIADRKHPAQKLWGAAPTGKVLRGSSGGSAVISALKTARTANPNLANTAIAHSLFNRVLGSD